MTETRVFVGRERERAENGAALARAEAGQGALVLLAGEPGIGKTRLADEAADDARGRGFEVLWGRCWEGEAPPAYSPWTQVLRALPHEVPAQMTDANQVLHSDSPSPPSPCRRPSCAGLLQA